MNRLVYLLLIGLLATACEIESSDNGQFDGYWQLRQQDTLATGGTTDMRESGIYWAVGFDLFEIHNTKDVLHSVLFRFNLKDDELLLSSPYYNDREAGDIRIDDPTLLHPYGLGSLEEHFAVEQLSKNHLQLRNDRYRFHLRKY